MGARYAGTSRDVDTYFQVPRGRLKLRRSESRSGGTLIYYDRPDRTKSRYSGYFLAPVIGPEVIEALLNAALGALVTVTKTRHLFLYGATRIHLDQVERLGRFVELETVILDQTEEEARTEHELVKHTLGLESREIVAVSYSDLLLDESRHAS